MNAKIKQEKRLNKNFFNHKCSQNFPLINIIQTYPKSYESQTQNKTTFL